jgi:hypothetical protein
MIIDGENYWHLQSSWRKGHIILGGLNSNLILKYAIRNNLLEIMDNGATISWRGCL